MKSRDSVLKAKRFQLEERRRQLGQIEAMIEEFGRMIGELDLEIAAEHRRTGISDEKHFAYSTFARAARQRSENLRASVKDLEGQQARAREAVEEAERELEAETSRLERDVGQGTGSRAAGAVG